jgi:hypothetical protein
LDTHEKPNWGAEQIAIDGHGAHYLRKKSNVQKLANCQWKVR